MEMLVASQDLGSAYRKGSAKNRKPATHATWMDGFLRLRENFGIWIFRSAAQKMKGYAKILAIEEMELDFLECVQKIWMDGFFEGMSKI